jgi:predicted TIM-barrel fold metal-dependent hydrolase
MDFERIIDSHTHWGPSLTLGTEVTTRELGKQQAESGVTYVVIMPFPSTAIQDNAINVDVLRESERHEGFIPYHYIREDYETEGFEPIPKGYFGGKWHWMRGWQDSASNYDVLADANLPELIRKLAKTGKPVILEEELAFTERFIEMAESTNIIIPHLGMLGGNPLDFLACFKNHSSVYFDTALASRDTILKFIETVGPERILFGSDVPFGTMRGELGKVLSLPIAHEEKESILSRNVMRLTAWRTPGEI